MPRLLRVLCLRPVSVFLARMVTPSSAAPCVSVIKPEMSPVVVRASAGAWRRTSAMRTIFLRGSIRRTVYNWGLGCSGEVLVGDLRRRRRSGAVADGCWLANPDRPGPALAGRSGGVSDHDRDPDRRVADRVSGGGWSDCGGCSCSGLVATQVRLTLCVPYSAEAAPAAS